MQQHGSKYFAHRPLPLCPWGHKMGSNFNRSKFSFVRTWSCRISNYMESQMQQHGSKHFAHRPPPPPPPPHPSERVHRSKFNFENMVMLHIKLTGITEYRNMIANVLLAKLPPPPRILGQKVKIQLFQNNVRLHIKLKGITNAAK